MMYKPKKSILGYKSIEQINRSMDINIWYTVGACTLNL